ncbi:28803_t:CDS:2 [Gigaspora margarita]|uniref:28803_t:CDS:1 n=1 Tax=Gigaspora margarita TaxID=4874 RepID=A0ABN7VZG8_GIGMA|nr:28803_t:CDS:2 [Gigaspora margarita]
MDLYYVRRLLAVAYNKLDNFISLCFQLSGWLIRMKDEIEVVDLDLLVYRHRSCRDPTIWYLVDMRLGTCECSPTGAPCMHQDSISKHYNVCGLNQIPITSVEKKYDYAYLALGEKRKSLSFYADLHQKKLEKGYTSKITDKEQILENFLINNINTDESDRFDSSDDENIFTLPESSNAIDSNDDSNDSANNNDNIGDNDYNANDGKSAIDKLCWFCNDLENLLKQNDSALNNSAQSLSSPINNIEICKTPIKKYWCCGKKIRVQITAASRRKGISHSLKKEYQEKQEKNSQISNDEMQKIDYSIMPAWKNINKNALIT